MLTEPHGNYLTLDFRKTHPFTVIDNEMHRRLRLDSAKFGPWFPNPFSNALNCPHRVLCDQWFRVRCGAFERRKVGWIAHIAERDAHIAQKAATLDSFDR